MTIQTFFPADARNVVSSVQVNHDPDKRQHDEVTIFNRGGHAGTITTCIGDGELIARRLCGLDERPQADRADIAFAAPRPMFFADIETAERGMLEVEVVFGHVEKISTDDRTEPDANPDQYCWVCGVCGDILPYNDLAGGGDCNFSEGDDYECTQCEDGLARVFRRDDVQGMAEWIHRGERRGR